jgi:hypothetical protein
MPEDSIEIESGRVVLVPKRSGIKGPMEDSCAIFPVPIGKIVVSPEFVPIPGHPGTCGLRRLRIRCAAKGERPSEHNHVLVAHAPYLLVGDHSFVYTRTPSPMSEPGRALRACAGTKRSGTYRTDSSDIGVCLRTGWRRATYQIRATSQTEAVCEVVEAVNDDD